MKSHIKSMILKVAAFSLAIAAGQSAANNTEFRYEVIDDTTVKVGFWNNAYYSKERAQEIVFDKIAQLALQQGATHFELVQPQVATDYVATSSNQDQNAASGEVVKTMISAPSRQNRNWDQAGTIIFPRYFFTTQVKLHKNTLPQSPNKVYNAKSVVAQQQRLVEPFKSVTRAEAENQAATAHSSQKDAGAKSTEGANVAAEVAEWTNKSYQHLQKNEWVEAIRTASAAINLDPSFDIPYINRATAYIQHGYKDKAQSDIDTALALNPDNALSINMHGYLLQEKGSKQDAMTFYRKACGMKLEIGCSNFMEVAGFRPDKPMEETNYYLDKSAEAMEKNRWSEVIDWSTKAIEADPENYKAYSNRAGALAEEKRAKEALLDADMAIALNPNFGPAYHNRGHAYQIMGNARDAALEFEIGCSLGIKDSCTEFNNLNSVAKK